MIISKKGSEYGKDIFGISYEAFIENNIFVIKLDIKNNENLLIEYRLLDMSLEIDRITFSDEKSVGFQLKKFGKLGVRIYFRKADSPSTNYTFLSERIEYNEKSAFEYLNPNKQNYAEAISQIPDIIEAKNKKIKSIAQIINNLHAISSFNYNITEYFKEQGIREISIFGHQDEIELSKLVWINARYARDFDLKYCLTDNYFEYHVPFVTGQYIPIKHQVLDQTATFSENDVILFCTSDKNEKILNDIRNKTEAKVIHISDVIHDILLMQFYTKRLIEIKNNNPEIAVIFCRFPYLRSVQNKSEIEQKTLYDFYLKNKITPPALERFGYSFEESLVLNKGFDLIKINNISYCKNINSEYRNVVNNFRLTTDQPDNFKNTIYMFGNSIIFCMGAEDSDTISSYLQRAVNEYFTGKESYCVINCSNFNGTDYDCQFDLMETMSFKRGDIIITGGHWQYIVNAAKHHSILCPTQRAFERPHDMGEVFIDKMHLNKIGNQKIAELLFQTMLDNNLFDNQSNSEQIRHSRAGGNTSSFDVKSENEQNQTNTQISDNFIPKSENENLKAYKELLLKNKSSVKGRIGSIVMNCNPFTLGHRYLIEESLKKVDYLYIFVVEEDKSFFPFKDRFELVKEGTEDLNNITVIPSGRFIISSLTFEAYSNKEKLQDETIDASNDVNIFATEIAPILDINIRFAGEEPLDNITRQYNNTMRMILPRYNIDFEVIKRKESDSEPISASRVRKLLESKDFEAIAKIVPESTLGYLIEKFG